MTVRALIDWVPQPSDTSGGRVVTPDFFGQVNLFHFTEYTI